MNETKAEKIVEKCHGHSYNWTQNSAELIQTIHKSEYK